MKQLLLDLKNGNIFISSIPKPNNKKTGIIIKTSYSIISAGTELSTIQLANDSYINKAKKKPEMVKKLFEISKKQGPLIAYQALQGRLNQPLSLGYSCSGIVIEVGEDVDIKLGDRVACGGVGYANHSEINFIPKNLAVKVPDNVTLFEASYTTIGSIAIQGIRNAKISIGERVLVIGLGLLGQITTQILKASGCKVYGIDLDKRKIELAISNGMNNGCLASEINIEKKIMDFSNDIGVDATIITTATNSDEPLKLAGKATRKRGRVILIGTSGMEIPREEYYNKELEFIISCSYGPGRYDRNYEENGIDYPVGYVRWTERRNMESFLELISEKKIDVNKISTHIFDFIDSPKAYEMLLNKSEELICGIVLKYQQEVKAEEIVKIISKKKIKGKINIGVIGAGSFLTTTLIDALKKVKDINLVGIASAGGVTGKSIAVRYGFSYCTSNYKKLLKDKSIDAVVIATRSSLHAPITIEAIENGKHVFVEKPMVVSKKELELLQDTNKKYPNRVIQVGFNRRYASFTKKLIKQIQGRTGPLIMVYRVNSDPIPDHHWAYDKKEGGNLLINEICHFIDYFKFITNSTISDSQYFTAKIPSNNNNKEKENIIINLKAQDGSIGTIIYNTISDPSFNKEYIEVHTQNMFIKIFDFKIMEIYQKGKKIKYKKWLKVDKGHEEELNEFINNIKNGNNPFLEWIDATRISLS